MTKSGHPWHVPVRLEDVPDDGLRLELVADESVRASVGVLAEVRDLPRLEAAIEVARHGEGLRATGQVSATVGQTCVISLDPMESRVEETFDVIFVPDAAADPAAENAEPAEPLVDGIADVGAVATEFFLLGIDRYPKKPGAVFAPPPEDSVGGSPFAALGKLRNDGGKP